MAGSRRASCGGPSTQRIWFAAHRAKFPGRATELLRLSADRFDLCLGAGRVAKAESVTKFCHFNSPSGGKFGELEGQAPGERATTRGSPLRLTIGAGLP